MERERKEQDKAIDIVEFYKSHTIDSDFDAAFYAKEYPETKNFYQPHCINNNLNDKQRLFFHWFVYGRINNYKNQTQKQNDKFIPNINNRNLNRPNKTAVITSLFNPCGYINQKYNYWLFSEHIKKSADLFTIELSFDNSFLTNKNDNAIHLHANNSNVLWQKERLLNILLSTIPKEYTNIAWIDADIIFADPYWEKRLCKLLDQYKVIHLFERAYRFNAINSMDNKISDTIILDSRNGCSGFAWAARREILDEIKLLDNQIVGGADYIMAVTFMSKLSLLNKNKIQYIDDKQTKKWIYKTQEIVNKSLGYLSGTINHLYHGSIVNRKYIHRTNMLFDTKNTDVRLDHNNLWSLNNDTKDYIEYFIERNEDDNILVANDYFNQIYVLNLEKDIDKFNEVQSKLSKHNIVTRRFIGVNGDNLNYKNDNYTHGNGELENQYALGCLMSHRQIIQDAKNNNYNRILILEDDIMIIENFRVYLQKLKKIPHWKLLYLGGSQYQWRDIEHDKDFYYAKNTLGTFAYAVDSSIYDQILDYNVDRYSIDWVLSQIQQKYYKDCYVFYPNLCIADVSSSKIRQPRNQEQHNIQMRWNLAEYE